MRATIVALVLCLLLTTPAGALTFAGTGTTAGDLTHESPATAAVDSSRSVDTSTRDVARFQDAQDLSTPETIDVQIRDDGDARFTITADYPTETESERAAFERIAQEFQRGEYDLGLPFFQTVVEDASEETDRSMELTATNRATPIDGDTGQLVQEFTWTNFAVVTEGRVEIQDAFQTGDGVWLRSLERDQELILRAPEGYGVAHSEPKSSVRGSAVIWEGPQTFQEGDFQTEFDSSQSPFGNGVDDAWLVLAVVGALLLLLSGYLLFRRLQRDGLLDERQLPRPSRLARSIPNGRSRSGGGASGEEPAPADDAGDDTAAADADADTAVAGARADEAPATDAETDEVDPELISDEERVERLLERNGGRMKQAKIVDETGWSNAKVSQLLSEMAEEGKVDKLRIGRENLITLPDEDVTALE